MITIPLRGKVHPFVGCLSQNQSLSARRLCSGHAMGPAQQKRTRTLTEKRQLIPHRASKRRVHPFLSAVSISEQVQGTLSLPTARVISTTDRKRPRMKRMYADRGWPLVSAALDSAFMHVGLYEKYVQTSGARHYDYGRRRASQRAGCSRNVKCWLSVVTQAVLQRPLQRPLCGGGGGPQGRSNVCSAAQPRKLESARGGAGGQSAARPIARCVGLRV